MVFCQIEKERKAFVFSRLELATCLLSFIIILPISGAAFIAIAIFDLPRYVAVLVTGSAFWIVLILLRTIIEGVIQSAAEEAQ